MSTAHQVVDPVAPDIRPDRLAVSPSEAAGMLGISKPSFYNLLNSGQIPSIRVGQRRLISVLALRRFVEGEI